MPAAMHMAGHHTQWNRMISLPIRWWTAGHHGLEPSASCAVADGRQVVDQGVVPDVEDVPLVPGDPHPPVDRGPGDGDVPEAALDEAEGLVALGLGDHGAGVGLVPVDQPLLEGARAGRSSSPLRGARPGVRWMGHRLPVEQLVLRVVLLAGDAVQAAVGVLVDVAVVVDPCRGTAGRPAWCRGSVVRMKSSLEMSRSAQAAANRGPAGRSTPAGSRPCSSAARATFWPCSSVPVRKKTSSPIRRCQRARASALTVV